MDDLKDLHIHLEQGPYTVSWIEAFVKTAAERNISEITLLEHSIRFKEFHKTFKEAREYNLYQRKWFDEKAKRAHSIDEFKAVAEEIRSREYPVKINFGIEICWFEQHEREIRELVSDGFFDHLIGSVHWIDNWTFNQRKYQWQGRDFDEIYTRYFKMENTLMKSGIFDTIAHPDLVICHSLYPSYDLTDTYREFCKTAKANNVAVEMNTSRGNKKGLGEAFFKIALQEGVTFSTGSDAHNPKDVGKGIAEVTNLLKTSDASLL